VPPLPRSPRTDRRPSAASFEQHRQGLEARRPSELPQASAATPRGYISRRSRLSTTSTCKHRACPRVRRLRRAIYRHDLMRVQHQLCQRPRASPARRTAGKSPPPSRTFTAQGSPQVHHRPTRAAVTVRPQGAGKYLSSTCPSGPETADFGARETCPHKRTACARLHRRRNGIDQRGDCAQPLDQEVV
jgi:hypothetical protein